MVNQVMESTIATTYADSLYSASSASWPRMAKYITAMPFFHRE